MHKTICIILFFVLTLLLFFTSVYAGEINSRYTAIVYSNETQLRKFNKEIKLGSLSYLMKDRTSISFEDEIKNKMDVLIEKVESILEMYPRQIKISIVLLDSEKEVQGVYYKKYGRNVDFIAFYSPKDKTIYLSINDVELAVLAHELAHAVIDHYYGIMTPAKIHEVLAQYVETHLFD